MKNQFGGSFSEPRDLYHLPQGTRKHLHFRGEMTTIVSALIYGLLAERVTNNC